MIKNERQYRITRTQADKFAGAIAALSSQERTDDRIHPLIQQSQVEAMRGQLSDLQEQLAEYDALKTGDRTLPSLSSFLDLPNMLIQRRIAAGLGHKQLAERLGLKEQQIQHYEATDYAGASFSRLKEIIHAL